MGAGRKLGALLAAVTAAAPMLLARSASCADTPAYFKANCVECHDADTHKGNLDLTSLAPEFADPEVFARWVKVYDRVSSGQMPPKKRDRPPEDQTHDVLKWVHDSLVHQDQERLAARGHTVLRRMTRAEYENTVRDLLHLPGLSLQAGLPSDGMAHGFDKNSEALDISHVNMAKYMEAADHALTMAIITEPKPPLVMHLRLSLTADYATRHIIGNGDAIMLRDMAPDPEFPPADDTGSHIDQGAHERAGLYDESDSVGMFRNEDESFHPTFCTVAVLYPGMYRLKASFWSFGWDKGKMLPGRGVEAASLSAVQLREDGRGNSDGSRILGYFDAPSFAPKVHTLQTWLNYKETIGFNVASLVPQTNYNRKGRAMAFTGPAIASDWLELEGPIYDQWPPESHRALFGELQMAEFKPAEHANMHVPVRTLVKQEIGAAKNQADPTDGIWTVRSDYPPADADHLLAVFLPRAFRHPVSDQVRHQYVARVRQRIDAGDTFEGAMRWVYRAALCSPDFLYHLETADGLDDYALASRLSYFLWNSMPDDELTALAASGAIKRGETLDAQVERMLKDSRSQRFIEDFLGQWLKLRLLAANDPDRKLYPEFSLYLQDSMRNETLAYLREMLDRDLDTTYLVRSNFAMLNEKLAAHYGVEGVVGSEIRRVPLPEGCPRGGFLTQASVLKVTANGTTTSPVVRGAFVMGRLLGQPPEPPPPNIPAIEPDVQGAKTIREQLDKHRNNATCASCHAKIDPPGFALESFDVIGGQRSRYRSIGAGEHAPRGNIDPAIGISFNLGPPVDPSGMLPTGQAFGDIRELQKLLADNQPLLLKNMAEQFAVYATGHEVTFSDREAIDAVVKETLSHGGGIRTLIHALVKSPLFQTK